MRRKTLGSPISDHEKGWVSAQRDMNTAHWEIANALQEKQCAKAINYLEQLGYKTGLAECHFDGMAAPQRRAQDAVFDAQMKHAAATKEQVMQACSRANPLPSDDPKADATTRRFRQLELDGAPTGAVRRIDSIEAAQKIKYPKIRVPKVKK